MILFFLFVFSFIIDAFASSVDDFCERHSWYRRVIQIAEDDFNQGRWSKYHQFTPPTPEKGMSVIAQRFVKDSQNKECIDLLRNGVQADINMGEAIAQLSSLPIARKATLFHQTGLASLLPEEFGQICKRLMSKVRWKKKSGDDIKGTFETLAEVSPEKAKELFQDLSQKIIKNGIALTSPRCEHIEALLALSRQSPKLLQDFSTQLLLSRPGYVVDAQRDSNINGLLDGTPLSKGATVAWVRKAKTPEKDRVLKHIFKFGDQGYEAFATDLSLEIPGFLSQESRMLQIMGLLRSPPSELSKAAREALTSFIGTNTSIPMIDLRSFLDTLHRYHPNTIEEAADSLFKSFTQQGWHEHLATLWKKLIDLNHKQKLSTQVMDFCGLTKKSPCFFIPQSEAQDPLSIFLYNGLTHGTPEIRLRIAAFLPTAFSTPLTHHIHPDLVRCTHLDIVRSPDTSERKKCEAVKFFVKFNLFNSDPALQDEVRRMVKQYDPESLVARYVQFCEELSTPSLPQHKRHKVFLRFLELENTHGVQMPYRFKSSMQNVFDRCSWARTHRKPVDTLYLSKAVIMPDRDGLFTFPRLQNPKTGQIIPNDQIISFNPLNGYEIWRSSFSQSTSAYESYELLKSRKIMVGRSVVWGQSGSELMALDRSTGSLLWGTQIPKDMKALEYMPQPDGTLHIALDNTGLQAPQVRQYDPHQRISSTVLTRVEDKPFRRRYKSNKDWLVNYDSSIRGISIYGLNQKRKAYRLKDTNNHYSFNGALDIHGHHLIYVQEKEKEEYRVVFLDMRLPEKRWIFPTGSDEIHHIHWSSQIFLTSRRYIYILDYDDQTPIPTLKKKLQRKKMRCLFENTSVFIDTSGIYETRNEQVLRYNMDTDNWDFLFKPFGPEHLLGVNRKGEIITSVK